MLKAYTHASLERDSIFKAPFKETTRLRETAPDDRVVSLTL